MPTFTNQMWEKMRILARQSASYSKPTKWSPGVKIVTAFAIWPPSIGLHTVYTYELFLHEEMMEIIGNTQSIQN